MDEGDMEAVLSFDGACEPNPGLGSWGFVIHMPDGDIHTGSGVIPAPTTNNVAEWTALEMGLRKCVELTDRAECAGRVHELTIRGDSQLVIHQLSGKWACKAEHLKPFVTRCRGLASQLPGRAEWVPREANGEADALTVAAWETHTGKPFPHRSRS